MDSWVINDKTWREHLKDEAEASYSIMLMESNLNIFSSFILLYEIHWNPMFNGSSFIIHNLICHNKLPRYGTLSRKASLISFSLGIEYIQIEFAIEYRNVLEI